MLEEGISDHRHERVTMKALPGSSLEVVEAEASNLVSFNRTPHLGSGR